MTTTQRYGDDDDGINHEVTEVSGGNKAGDDGKRVATEIAEATETKTQRHRE